MNKTRNIEEVTDKQARGIVFNLLGRYKAAAEKGDEQAIEVMSAMQHALNVQIELEQVKLND